MSKTRPMNYRTKTVEQLIEAYAFETDRISREDAEITQGFIRDELFERVKSAFRQLDNGCSPESVYKQFIGG